MPSVLCDEIGTRGPVRVAVHASDVFTHVGISRYLETRRDVELLPPDQRRDADVVVLAPARVTPGALAELRAGDQAAVLLVDEVSEADLLAAVEARVTAVLPRDSAMDERLARSIVAAARRTTGTAAAPSDLPGELRGRIDELRKDGVPPRRLETGGLSPREVEVLRLMSEGFDTGEIAQRLCYSERTVKNIIHGMTSRLRLRNRPHAVAYAMRAGVI
ncbi:helix-turn-helix transcriptional regulator [Actinophytocola gossypii]|uniref:Response regulator transcription factor n=1 Tax=Actinophytocola gossypii TaxID=2812003 RepID=A0ABT2J5L8_9PSEU|nr:LuxR C-terminal-related transcriptional regulator [Actinophytocola gossypii]MCT2583154.1 response regulator transcription factor [Actinophytocola gossypii]